MADFDLPDDLYYSNEDEWVRLEEGTVLVGVTDYAQQQLGDVVFVELPEPGTNFEKGEPFGVIESVKAVSDLYAPLSGEVVAVNRDLAARPEVVNEDCYGDGWMITVAPGDKGEIEELMDAAAYRKLISERQQD